jgi:hypothetical protein
VAKLSNLNGANPYTKNRIGETNFSFFTKKEKNSTMLRCSKNLDSIYLSVRSVKKPIKTKTRTLVDIEPKLHGISINQPKFYTYDSPMLGWSTNLKFIFV